MAVESCEMSLDKATFEQLMRFVTNVSEPLSTVAANLWQSFGPSGMPSTLALGSSLASLLQDDLLPEQAIRMVAIYILYDTIIARSPLPPGATSSGTIESLIESPLTVILFDLIENESRPAEHLFLTHLLNHSQNNSKELPIPGQIAKSSAGHLSSALENAVLVGNSPVPKLNLLSLRRLWTERHPEPATPPGYIQPVSGIVSDPDTGLCTSRGIIDDLQGPVSLSDFIPRFVRPAPPIMEITADELQWIDPEILHEVAWDTEMGADTDRGTEVKGLISKAMKAPLPEHMQKVLLSKLEEDPKLVHVCGITPRNLPDLVQNNSKLATDVLLRLVTSKQSEEYFKALVNMEMNLHSMEVVNRLTSAVELPNEFLHTYISNCIRSCGSIPDKYGQIKMVRFVCVFLQSLIKNKIIDGQEIYIEVQGFCMEYSRIREVADLFRLLKNHGAQQ